MKATLVTRIGAVIGLAVAASAAAWWLAHARLALDQGMDPARGAGQALDALWLARAIVLMVLVMTTSARSGLRLGTAAGLVVSVPAMPLVLLVGSASTVPWVTIARAELALIAASVVVALIGDALHRTIARRDVARLLGTAIGISLAALAFGFGVPSVFGTR
jgi:hypothetical protein